mmetsp:Transcript_39842/g.66087  ORF Transcript_39842/g.66087 Transcript_39842/m.66087 type:complete len:205 (-) Transcript_39842:690-1304(-)
MSIPRAATSVATSTANRPSRNFFSVTSLWVCETSPCSGWGARGASAAETQSSSASRLVDVNTIVRDSGFAPCTAIKSASVCARALSPSGINTATWSTVVAASEEPCPTTSTVFASLRCCRATERTHGGCVAENRTVCRSEASVPSRIVSTSSLKPMFSISSASSSTTYSTPLKSSVPSCKWSMIRPGVPTSTSNPSRSVRCCGG